MWPCVLSLGGILNMCISINQCWLSFLAFQTSTAPNFFDSPAQGSDADFDQVFGGGAPVSSSSTPSNTGVLQPVAAENVAPNLVTKQHAQDDSARSTGDLWSSLERATKSLGGNSYIISQVISY